MAGGGERSHSRGTHGVMRQQGQGMYHLWEILQIFGGIFSRRFFCCSDMHYYNISLAHMHMGTQEVLRHRGGGLDGTYNLWKIKKRFQKTNIIIYLYNDNE